MHVLGTWCLVFKMFLTVIIQESKGNKTMYAKISPCFNQNFSQNQRKSLLQMS